MPLTRSTLARLAALLFALVLVSTAAACGGDDDVLDEETSDNAESGSNDGDDGGDDDGGDDDDVWETHVDGTGAWSVETPVAMESMTQSAQGLDVTIDSAEVDEDFFALATTVIPAGTPVDLDGAVDGATSSAMASVEAQLGTSAEMGEVQVETGDIGGVETRRYSTTIDADGQTAVLMGVVLVDDTLLVQAMAIDVDDDDTEDAERFIDSLAPVS
jgi:hypothetical protein